jgi:hypothetical protein
MNLKSKLAAAVLMISSASMAQASTYNVSATFDDGGMQAQTVFNGSFNWDGSTVSNFTGLLSESMWGWNSSRSGGVFDSNGTAANGMSAAGYQGNVYAKPGGYMDNEAPLLNLNYQLASSTSGNLVTVSTFLQNSTDVVDGGGFDVVSTDNAMKFGNNNAFFTLVFDKTNLANTVATTNQIVYGDMTPLALMMPMLKGSIGMTGYASGGSMGGAPVSLSITPAAVPVPAAVWLFGSALFGLAGFKGRKSALSA